MLRNRLIFLFLALAAGTFSSFYGGASYLLLFVILILPLVSFLYLVYVFLTLRISQDAEERILYKGGETPYCFSLVNERKIIYSGVQVDFKSGLFEVEGLEQVRNYSLLPKDRIDRKARIRCLYRGTYAVGVDSVTVTDFLNLFQLKRKIDSPVQVQVLPRVIRLNKLAAAPLDDDAKTLPFSLVRMQDQPDVESRAYTAGDGLKMVNWKLSAKQQELVVRKYVDAPKTKILLILDLAEIRADSFTKIAAEDQIIEAALAIADYFVRRRTPVEVFYSENGPKATSMKLQNQASFDRFFRFCSDVPFHSFLSADAILGQAAFGCDGRSCCIVVTHKVDEEFCRTADHILSLDTELSVVQAGGLSPEILHSLDKRVRLFQISKGQEIADVLETQQGGRL